MANIYHDFRLGSLELFLSRQGVTTYYNMILGYFILILISSIRPVCSQAFLKNSFQSGYHQSRLDWITSFPSDRDKALEYRTVPKRKTKYFQSVTKLEKDTLLSKKEKMIIVINLKCTK